MPTLPGVWRYRVSARSGAGIMEANDRQATTVFTVQPVIPPSALDKPSIMKRYHRRRTCSHTSSFADDGNASWYSVCRVPMVEWRLDWEDCRHLLDLFRWGSTYNYLIRPLHTLCITERDNNDNNRIQKAQFKIITISSLRRELSPTRTLKWPGRNRAQITCNTSRAYHVQHVVCHLVRRDSSAIKFDRV